jgi:hypothetical protein
MAASNKRYVRPGEDVTVMLPHSEVCLSMRVADRIARVRLEPSGRSAQIMFRDGRPFSFPVLRGEAGLYEDENGVYGYEETRGRWIGEYADGRRVA